MDDYNVPHEGRKKKKYKSLKRGGQFRSRKLKNK